MEGILENGHWESDSYTQRITMKEWRTVLFERKDSIIYNGRLTKLIAKPLGCGVLEISKDLSKKK